MARPSKYDEVTLIKTIKHVAKEYPEAKITFGFLEKQTGIPKHIWKSSTYPKVRPLIDRLNSKYSVTKELKKYCLQISNLIADVHSAQPEKLDALLHDRMMMEHRLYQMAADGHDKCERYSKELTDCQHKLANAEAEIESLRNQLAECYVKSNVEPVRRRENLKSSGEIVPAMTSLEDKKLSTLITGLLDE